MMWHKPTVPKRLAVPTCWRRRLIGMAMLTSGWVGGMSDSALLQVRNGFETRRDEAFASLRGEPMRPAPLRDPLGPGRAVYARQIGRAHV